jgi:hypothetical protein
LLCLQVNDSQDLRNAGSTLTFQNDKRILNRAVELHNEYVHHLIEELGPDNFKSTVFFQPFPKFISDISNQKGGNMLGTDRQEGNAIIWTGSVAVNSSQSGMAIAQTRMDRMVAELSRFSKELGDENRLVYMNYADESQDPLGSYGKKNVEHMKRVAARYDPMGVWQTRVPGGFKISRVHT